VWRGALSLTDALGRLFPHRAQLLDLVSPTPGQTLSGPAVTIRFVPYRADRFDAATHNFARLSYEAIGSDPAGKVLVLDSSGYRDTSMGGGTKLSRVQNHDLAGLITDGRLRDFRELAALDPVFYCRGEAVQAGTVTVMPVAANVPVVLGGVTILPGDYIYSDGAGAVVLPESHFDQIVVAAVEIEAEDSRFLEAIRNEDRAEIARSGSSET